MQTFTFLQLAVFSILICVSPSNALFADPEQARLEEFDRLAFAALRPVASKVGIIMAFYLEMQTVLPISIHSTKRILSSVYVLLINLLPLQRPMCEQIYLIRLNGFQ